MVLLTDDTVHRRLSTINNSQESIETTSLWVMHHADSARMVVECWLNLFRAAPDDRRITLFYLMNDVVQRSKRKHLDPIAGVFEPAVVSAVNLARTSEKVRGVMSRCLSLIASCKGFSRTAHERMTRAIEDHNGENEDSTLEIDNTEFAKKITTFVRGVSAMRKGFDTATRANLDFTTHIATRMKDKREGQALLNDAKLTLDRLTHFRQAANTHMKQVYELIETVENAKRCYNQQLRDVAFVEDAYVKFGQGIREVQEELKEMIATGVYPAASPPRDAPSPQADDDIFADGVERALSTLRPAVNRDNLDPADMEMDDDDGLPMPQIPARASLPGHAPFNVPPPTIIPLTSAQDPRNRARHAANSEGTASSTSTSSSSSAHSAHFHPNLSNNQQKQQQQKISSISAAIATLAPSAQQRMYTPITVSSATSGGTKIPSTTSPTAPKPVHPQNVQAIPTPAGNNPLYLPPSGSSSSFAAPPGLVFPPPVNAASSTISPSTPTVPMPPKVPPGQAPIGPPPAVPQVIGAGSWAPILPSNIALPPNPPPPSGGGPPRPPWVPHMGGPPPPSLAPSAHGYYGQDGSAHKPALPLKITDMQPPTPKSSMSLPVKITDFSAPSSSDNNSSACSATASSNATQNNNHQQWHDQDDRAFGAGPGQQNHYGNSSGERGGSYQARGGYGNDRGRSNFRGGGPMHGSAGFENRRGGFTPTGGNRAGNYGNHGSAGFGDNQQQGGYRNREGGGFQGGRGGGYGGQTPFRRYSDQTDQGGGRGRGGYRGGGGFRGGGGGNRYAGGGDNQGQF